MRTEYLCWRTAGSWAAEPTRRSTPTARSTAISGIPRTRWGRGSMNDFEQVFGRVVQATGIASQTGLAEVLGVSPSAVSDAKKRGKFSAEWLLKLLEKQGINPVWLKSGAGPKRLGAAGLPVVEAVVHGLACEYSDADERTAIHTQGSAALPAAGQGCPRLSGPRRGHVPHAAGWRAHRREPAQTGRAVRAGLRRIRSQ
ncbi:MAG: bacteriophage CI repressor [Desulfovibrio desulfuricans]|nr:bacteriophage CI repressor [Desulfovibrio desulfuricans]